MTSGTAATGWTKIGNDVIDVIPEIGHATFAVYVVIAKHANAAGVAWPSIRTIAQLTGATIRTVQRSLKTLQVKGLIRVERRKDSRGRPAPNRYTLSPVRDGDTRALPPPKGMVTPVSPYAGATTLPTVGYPKYYARTIRGNDLSLSFPSRTVACLPILPHYFS